MKILHLLRHAKSSWNEPKVEDHERPLSPRGERSVVALATALPGMKVRPDLVLCSTALRARATCAALSEVLPMDTIDFDSSLYLASATALVARLRRIPEGVNELLLIGHNPGFEDLALLLIRHAPQQLRAKLSDKLPTGALLSLELDIDDWRLLGLDSARLVRFWPHSAPRAERKGDKRATRATHKKALDVEKQASWSELADAAVGQCRTHAYANLAGALHGHTESIHQLRVALRRLRVALRTFEDCFDKRSQERARDKTRVVFHALGRVRELDVIERDILATLRHASTREPGLGVVRGRLTQARQRRLQELRTTLDEPEIRAFTQALDALDVQKERATAHKPRARARTQLDKKLAVVLELTEGKVENSERLHALRKELKKLRYRVDFFAHLFAKKDVRDYSDVLARLQDKLGVLNDVAVARTALTIREGGRGTPSVTKALERIGKHLSAREDEAISGLAAELDELSHAVPFWR